MAKRFWVVDESISAHCCFNHSIVDTYRRHNSDPGFYRGPEWNGDQLNIAEVFNEADAHMICDALNKAHEEQMRMSGYPKDGAYPTHPKVMYVMRKVGDREIPLAITPQSSWLEWPGVFCAI